MRSSSSANFFCGVFILRGAKRTTRTELMHTRAAVALLLAGACLFGERPARAQACCTSTATIFPARLQDSENALVGLRASAAAIYGSFDDQRVLRGQPGGASEIDFGQTLLVTARAGNEPVQFSLAVPFV